MVRSRSLSLADAVAPGVANGFNAVRLVLAAAVLVSHSCAMTGVEYRSEPLWGITPFTLGQHAVNGFFALSGCLLAGSWARRPGLARFARARALRVLPGLLALGVVTALVIAPLAYGGALAAYLRDPAAWTYPFRLPFQLNHALLPEGAFPNGAYPGRPNGSLWTIKYELAAYAAFGVAAALGLARGRWAPLLALALTGAAVAGLGLAPALTERWPALAPPARLFMAFAVGVAAHAVAARLVLSPAAALLGFGAAALLHGTALEAPAYVLAVGYGVLVAGGRLPGALARPFARADLSYGLYLYAWPVQQALLARWPALGAVPHAVEALAITLPLAWLSWSFVEAPALALKGAALGSGHVGTGRVAPAASP